MNTLDFKQEHSKEILEFEKETGKQAILRNGRVTGNFKLWLHENNIQLINTPCNHLLKFFLDFLKEHHYFSKKTLVGIYIQKAHPSKDEFDEIWKEFGRIIRRHLKSGVLEYYSVHNFKINKLVLEGL